MVLAVVVPEVVVEEGASLVAEAAVEAAVVEGLNSVGAVEEVSHETGSLPP